MPTTVQPDIGAEDAPKPLVRIVQGPGFLIAGHDDRLGRRRPHAKAQAAATVALRLRDGDPGRAVEVVAAEGRAVSAIQRLGYADAQSEPREVVVDHADHTLRPTFKIKAGELVLLDGLDLTTDGRTRKGLAAGAGPLEERRRLRSRGRRRSLSGACWTRSLRQRHRGACAIEKKTAQGLRPIVVAWPNASPGRRVGRQLRHQRGPRPRRQVDALQRAGARRHRGPGGPALQHRQSPGGRSHTAALGTPTADAEGECGVLPQPDRRLR
jgi:hypothetical protein